MLAGRTPRIVAEPCSPMRLLSHSRTASSSSSTTTSTASPWLGHSTLYARYWQHRRVLSSPMRCWDWQTQPTPRRTGGLTASTSASTLPFLPHLPRLRRRLSSTSTTALTALTSASPPSTTTASTRLRHHHGAPRAPAAPSTWQSDHNYVDLGHLQHGFFDHGYCALTLGYLDIGTKGYRLA